MPVARSSVGGSLERRLRAAGVVIVGTLALASVGPETAQPGTKAPLVLAAVVDSILHPVSAEFMVNAIDRAEREGASLVVFTLRTPGGLVDSTRGIVTRMVSSKVPVAVFVAPSGGRAASAGFVVVLASDIAAMAPGTHIGAATPVAGGGVKLDEAAARKATEDMAAYVRTLAQKRGRNVALAEEAVKGSRAFTETEALRATPPLIDLVAPDLGSLLDEIDGRTITRFDGSSVVLRTAGGTVVPLEMNWRQRILSAIANPDVAYILLSLGTLGLTIELWSPGAILPGVVGGLCLLLAFFAFQVLPINAVGLLLILFGLVLLVLEIKVTSFGLLTAGGLAGLVLGAMLLVDSPAPELQVSLRTIAGVTVGVATVMLFLVRLAVNAQRQRAVTGTAGMIGQTGKALGPIAPGTIGQVATRGEIWQARSTDRIETGDAIRVMDVDGLVLTVHRVDS
jgi:membrane-bound serine protease (ClpP class)